jgi:hypothetical protein
MSITTTEGTIIQKINRLLHRLRKLNFPIFENMKNLDICYNHVECNSKIVQVDMKFLDASGKEEIIFFNQKELENMKVMKDLKGELLKLEETKKELNRKVHNTRNELMYIENTEAI